MLNKLQHLNNVAHSWLDDHEVAKLLALMTVIITNYVVLITCWPNPVPVFSSLGGFMLVFVSRFVYLKIGHFIPKQDRRKA